uniref:histidine phosphatase family protein n=1 Tax=Roseivirga sp. TaxID=1964215 RepID=UPI00404885F0
MIKKIYLTRHGQTDFNLKGIVQGRGVNADLNETGRAQAQAFYSAYGHLKFNKLYVSTLKRTHQSMKGFIDTGLEYEELSGLDEISWGVHEGMEIDQAQHAYYFEMINRWQNGETHLAIEGGESPEQLATRLKDSLDYILGKENESQILICMHGRAMRLLLAIMLNYPYKGMDYFEHNNLGLYELTYTGKTFVLDNYNDTNHLRHL